MSVVIEACVGSLASVRAAIKGGASRVELCDRLDLGGTTPCAEFVAEAVALCRGAGVHAMVIVRCRGGDFVYTEAEVAEMAQSIATLASLGVDGFVVGALTVDTSVSSSSGAPVYLIDRTSLETLAAVAPPTASLTFHRAFDDLLASVSIFSTDVVQHRSYEALSTIADVGCDRVLTSGGASTAPAGLPTLAALATAARTLRVHPRAESDGAGQGQGKARVRLLQVMPGAGVGSRNIAELARVLVPLEVREFHGTFKRPQSLKDPAPLQGTEALDAHETDAGEVAAVAAAVAAAVDTCPAAATAAAAAAADQTSSTGKVEANN